MPLRFGFKKTRRYNVSSKNSYGVCVYLLDNTLIECALTADSTGRECLENIAQRIQLNEIEFFGLRYVNKKLQFRWVELDKPLKKQLDKHLGNSPLLYFGVMFYVASAHQIKDEMTRYQYYLQLKSDVIDGKLTCSQEQAVRLASYSVQAEFGDHDFEHHTADYLKDFVLLPKNMTTDERTLADLTQEVSATHKLLSGVPPAVAEQQYIIEAQQLEGYGLEYYPAKDDSGNELLLGASFVGIFVKHLNGQPTVYFKWADINQLIHNKRVFGIETSLSEQTVQFLMDNPDMAKYVYKMCCLQHKFYRTNKNCISGGDKTDTLDGHATGVIPDIQRTTQSHSNQDQSDSVAPSTSTAVLSPSTSNTVTESGLTVLPNEEFTTPTKAQVHVEPTLPTTPADVTFVNGQAYSVQQQMDTPAPVVSLAHVTTPQNTGPAYNKPGVQLPSYRPSPDYETVMRHRMERMAQQQNLEQLNNMANLAAVANISRAQVYTQPETMAYSQPEIGQSPSHYYVNQTPHSYAASVYTNAFLDMGGSPALQFHRPVDRSSSLIIHPTYSTPDLATSGIPNGALSTSDHRISEALLNHYKPPPPYPRSSSSTPDLASQTTRSTLSNSPDLVSRKNLSNAALVEQSRLDQSVENLTLEAHKLHFSQQMTPRHMDDSSSNQSDMTYHTNTVNTSTHSSMLDNASISGQTHLGNANELYVNSAVIASYANAGAASDTGHWVPGVQQNGNVFGSPSRVSPGGPTHTPVQQLQPYGMSASPHNLSSHSPHSAHSQAFSSPPHPQAFVGLDNPSFNLTDLDSDTIECLDTSQIASDHGSSVTHSKTSSMDTSSLSQAEVPGHVPDSEIPMDPSGKHVSMGPLKLAAMNGLSVSRHSVLEVPTTDSRAPKDERRKALENKLEEGQVFVEFEQVPRKAANADCATAGLPENKERNRFKDVHPYDHNRVKLTPSKDNSTGYINGSHIKMNVKGELWWYLAAQGPLPSTVVDFWQMVWEQNVDVVAMLTGVQEQGRSKCQQYWPDTKGSKHKVTFGDFQVTMQFSNDSGCYVTRGLTLRHVPSKRERLVWHLQYTDWPDHGCPEDIHGFLAYLDEIESVRRHVFMERNDGVRTPAVVHCSAGVGRSGVVILAEIMKACLEHNVDVDIPTVLGQLRTQRMYMVQTMSQYSFVYKTLVQFLNNARLI